MKRERRQQILWDLIDTMFTTVEYWNENPVYGELTEEEEYLFKTISSFAKKVNVTNHINVQ